MSFNNWLEEEIGNLPILIADGNYSSKYPKAEEFIQKGVPFISPKDINGRDILRNNIKYISHELHTNLTKGHTKENDVLITVRGTIGRIGFVKREFENSNMNAQMALLRPNPKVINPLYLYYYLSCPNTQSKIIALGSGSAQPQLPIHSLKKLKIILPSLFEQEGIANLLSSIDEKIELNYRIVKNLEEMAHAIFKNWFVDFEPFKDGEFIESELGMIPKGWKVVKLNEVIEIFDSKRRPLSSRERSNMKKNYPYYGATSIIDYVDDYLFDGTYVLMGEDGSVVDSNGFPILQYVWGKFWVSNHAHVLRGKNGYNEESLLILLKNTNVASIVTGAVQQKISQSNLKSIGVIFSTEKIISRFNEIISPIFSKIRLINEMNINLIKIRDSILPKLMSGEVKVTLEEI